MVLEAKPDGLIFTAKSAIPIADVYRGIFDSLGIERPKIGYVDPCAWTRPDITRLSTLLDGMKKAIVVDEYVDSGTTLENARRLVAKSGIQEIGCVIGRWYHSARGQDIIYDDVTSIYQKEMYDFGTYIAEQL